MSDERQEAVVVAEEAEQTKEMERVRGNSSSSKRSEPVDLVKEEEEDGEDWFDALLRKLGHPFTVDEKGRSVPDPDWCPYAHGDPRHVLYVDRRNTPDVDMFAFILGQMYKPEEFVDLSLKISVCGLVGTTGKWKPFNYINGISNDLSGKYDMVPNNLVLYPMMFEKRRWYHCNILGCKRLNDSTGEHSTQQRFFVELIINGGFIYHVLSCTKVDGDIDNNLCIACPPNSGIVHPPAEPRRKGWVKWASHGLVEPTLVLFAIFFHVDDLDSLLMTVEREKLKKKESEEFQSCRYFPLYFVYLVKYSALIDIIFIDSLEVGVEVVTALEITAVLLVRDLRDLLSTSPSPPLTAAFSSAASVWLFASSPPAGVQSGAAVPSIVVVGRRLLHQHREVIAVLVPSSVSAADHRSAADTVDPKLSTVAVGPAVPCHRCSHRLRSSSPPSGSRGGAAPRPPLRCRRFPPKHRRHRRPEDRRRHPSSFAVVQATGEFAEPSSTRWCPPFAPPCRRSPASTRCRAAAGDDIIADVSTLSAVDPW
uniref:DUF3615 domain-containing protein n=1 Tax=Oryza sativa subsp. japonica TaxID=39947 RepID=Q6YYJ1_ORYSJ|nr:hypothetical protein [Oryza sativa Japonica Group]